MMTMGPSLRSAPLVEDSFQRARWMCREALSRKAGAEAAERLMGAAAELAESADGRDQLLSLALTLGAEDMMAGRPPLETFPVIELTGGDDHPGAEESDSRRSESWAAAERLAASLYNRETQAVANPQERRDRLLALVALQGVLWRSPAIPASAGTRRVMRASAALILRRIV